jgi:hypothetical protein
VLVDDVEPARGRGLRLRGGVRVLRLQLGELSLHPRFGSFAEGLVRGADLAYFAGFVLISFAMARLSLAQVRVR